MRETEQEQPRAVIADDDPFARRVIKDVLQRSGVIVIAEARDGRQAVELTLHYHPDVVVMDVVMPELDGIMATREIRRRLPEQLIIVLTGASEDDHELGLQALRAGASGFLSKDLEIESLPPPPAGGGPGAGGGAPARGKNPGGPGHAAPNRGGANDSSGPGHAAAITTTSGR